jgi:hypothetical protein
MAITNVSNTYSSDIAISIPSNSNNVTYFVRSANGGVGGADAAAQGGSGGFGRSGQFRYITNFTARSVTIRIGQRGANGASDSNNTVLNCNGRTSAIGSGGCGGHPGPNGRSGQGASGAGSTGVVNAAGNVVVIAGGGGGGGGASLQRSGAAGGPAGGWQALGGFAGFSNGGNGESQTNDGGGGGGGGGGSPGGGGGIRGIDENRGGGGGVGGGSAYNSSVLSFLGSDNLVNGVGSITVSYELWTPEITAFSASPNPQTSGTDGNPRYSTSLTWTARDFTSLTLTSSAGESWNVTGGSFNISNLPQSTAGSNSPATRSYTLTACAGGVCTSRSVTVSAFNDNDRGNFSVPNQTNLEPNTLYVIDIGQTTSSQIDMITAVSGLNGATVSKNGSGSFSSTIFISPGDRVDVRFLSAPFNQDPNGLTNSLTYGVQIGPRQAFFTATTRAPVVRETFNYSNHSTKVPFPDIDTIETAPDHPAQPFIVTETLEIDDVELANPSGVEIKTNNPNVQVRKKRLGQASFTDWKDTRSI